MTQDGQPVQLSAPVFASDSPQIVEIDAATGQASFLRTGRATVTVTFSENVFPDSLLAGRLVVPVDSFSVEITPTSPTVDATGELLESDTVVFEATVERKDGRPVQTAGQQFVSGDAAVVSFVDDTAGLAALVAAGQAPVGVSFDEPMVPGGSLAGLDTFNVTDFSLTLSVASVAGSTAIASGDTLVSDSVQFNATLVKDGQGQPIVNPTWTSSDPSVIEILDASTGRAVFTDTGTAAVALTFSDPVVPQQGDSMVVHVGTYLVQISGPSSPVMGDTISYSATVVDSRTGSPVTASGPNWTSSDPAVVRVINPNTGATFVRDIGGADVAVAYADPQLPFAPVAGAMPVVITEERFYGAFSVTSGDFGDEVFVDSSGVHKFTDSTRVYFGNGSVGFVTSSTPPLLRFDVGAGSDTSQLTLVNLADESGGFRDSVLTRITFDGEGTVDDPFEDNDTFPLTNADEITSYPFEALLSWDPTKSAPADTNFFWFTLSGVLTFDIIADWQQDNYDINFTVCSGNGAPPTNYVSDAQGPICQRPASSNAQDFVEEELNLILNAGSYVLKFYCEGCSSAVPLTYRVRVTSQ